MTSATAALSTGLGSELIATSKAPRDASSEPSGIVFNIQRYSIHDGPGIRTVVFLKGCPMRCLWCSNPESQNFEIEIQTDLQTGAKSFVGKIRTASEVVSEVLIDRSYYRRSGGGITMSGGEPLAQIEFAEAVLSECHRNNIHTAVETAGGVPWSSFERVIPFVELFLYDLKQMNDHEHTRIVGVSNTLVLENIRRLAENGSRYYIRIPLIPGMNGSNENIQQTAKFVLSLPRLPESVHILPLHHYGSAKYKKLGRPYQLQNVEALVGTEKNPDGMVERTRRILAGAGLPVQVGG